VTLPQHTASTVDAIVDDEEVVVFGKLMLVYAVHTAFRRSTAQAVTRWHEACVLRASQLGILGCVSSQVGPHCHVGPGVDVGNVQDGRTYRLLASFSLGSVEGIMVLGDVQKQDVLIREVLLALGAPVHVGLMVVYMIVFEGRECKWLVRGKQALHDGGQLGHSQVCVEMHQLDVDRLVARTGTTGVVCRGRRGSV